MRRSRFLVELLSVSAALLSAGFATAQDYPTKPIRIVTSGVGGGSDFIARLIAQGIAGPLGQSVIVENRGSGIVQAEFLLKAPPDGYSLLVAGKPLWLGPLLQKMPYDALIDFIPVTLSDRSPSILTVHPSLPVKSVMELIALAKARPGQLNYASSGIGGASHLAGELFKYMAGVNIVWVGYKSGGHANTAVVSGEVQLQIADPNVVAPHVKSGRLRALAVTTAQPSPLVPGLPTVADSGVPGYEAAGLTGVFAPGKTPAAIINRLNQECARLLNQPEVKERLFRAGVEAVGSSQEQFVAIIKSDIARMGKMIKEAGIKVE